MLGRDSPIASRSRAGRLIPQAFVRTLQAVVVDQESTATVLGESGLLNPQLADVARRPTPGSYETRPAGSLPTQRSQAATLAADQSG